MLVQQSKPIKNWIEAMGFELVKSDFFHGNLLNYYHLGNFSVCEEIEASEKVVAPDRFKNIRFISWNPWGEDFEVNSVKDLDEAYQNSLTINPEMVVENQ